MTSPGFVTVPAPGTLRDAYVARMQAYYAAHGIVWEADLSDPARYWAQDTENVRRADAEGWNAAALAFSPLTATGSAVDALLARVGLTRRAEETDAAALLRYRLAWTSAIGGLPDTALRLARDAYNDPSVSLLKEAADASVVFQRAHNRYLVYFLDNVGLSLPLSDRIQLSEYMNDEHAGRVETWLQYQIQEASVVQYILEGTVRYAEGTPNPQLAVDPLLAAALIDYRRLNTEINRRTLQEYAWVAGVTDITLTIQDSLAQQVHVDERLGTSTYTPVSGSVTVPAADLVARSGQEGDPAAQSYYLRITVSNAYQYTHITPGSLSGSNYVVAVTNTGAHELIRRDYDILPALPDTVYHGTLGTIAYVVA